MYHLERSLRSDQKTFVRFINKTNRVIELIWIDFNGQYVRYRILEKDQFVDVNTYKTHPWMALDYFTKDRLHVDKKFDYHPKTTREFIKERYPHRVLPENYHTRIRAFITLPLYSLKYAALLAIRNTVKEASDVEVLELPRQLIEELKKSIEFRNRIQTALDTLDNS